MHYRSCKKPYKLKSLEKMYPKYPHMCADITKLMDERRLCNISEPNRGAIHQLLGIILKLQILVLLPVSTMPYVVIVKNYS
jgi:hypothetical protein